MALDLHVAVEEPTPCEVCGGDGIFGDEFKAWDVCSGCHCTICGKATDTPPECGDCALAEDDRAKRRADV